MGTPGLVGSGEMAELEQKFSQDGFVSAPSTSQHKPLPPLHPRSPQVILRSLFTAEEMALLTECVEEDPRGFADDGTRNRIWLWHESDLDTQDIYSGIAHCERIVSTVSRLLGEEVYLYHYKVIQKESGNAESVTAGRAGNEFAWHQSVSTPAQQHPAPLPAEPLRQPDTPAALRVQRAHQPRHRRQRPPRLHSGNPNAQFH